MTTSARLRSRAAIAAMTVAAMFAVTAVPAAAAQPKGTYSDWFWSSSGFYNMDFRIQPLSDPSPKPYFWSQQFWFEGGDGGYAGIQTSAARRPDGSDGKIAIFSIWDALDASGSSCNTFGGEGEGYSCRVALDWVVGHTYRLRVARGPVEPSGNWWNAWVRDLNTGEEQFIGSIKILPSWGLLQYATIAFTEYWLPIADCNELVLAKAYFRTPAANDGTKIPGPPNNHLSNDGDCPGSSISTESDGAIHVMGTHDTTPPSPPASLRMRERTDRTVGLDWTPAADNWAVDAYRVYRDGTPVGTTGDTWFTDTGLSPGTIYRYTVRAIDRAGNESADSSEAAALTAFVCTPFVVLCL